jgi:hypothetical protein
MPGLAEAQILARMQVFDWFKQGLVNPNIAQRNSSTAESAGDCTLELPVRSLAVSEKWFGLIRYPIGLGPFGPGPGPPRRFRRNNLHCSFGGSCVWCG